MADDKLVVNLVDSAAALDAFASNEDRFRAVADAFLANDTDTFHRLLDEAKVSQHCELICHWLRSKFCVLLCLELCGPPRTAELPELTEFAGVVQKIVADAALIERFAVAVLERNGEEYRALVADLKLERFCHLLCHWMCTVHYRLTCSVVCSPVVRHQVGLVEALVEAGTSVARLAASAEDFTAATAAVLAHDCDATRGIVQRLGLNDQCHLICEWFCAYRCIRVCLLLCRAFPFAEISSPLAEAFAFAGVAVKLAREPVIVARLVDAVVAGNAEAFGSLVKERQLEPYCIQLCHWICSFECHVFCVCVCPPFLQPWFTQIGHFNIYGDIDPATGLTNKALSFSGLGYGGGPNFAFTGCLELRGFCPTTSPSFSGVPMRYRFLYEHPAGNRVPLTAALLCAVDAGNRRIPWPENSGGVAGAATVQTFQDITIAGAPEPAPVPPAVGAPWYGPARHVIVPDADGWIAVDPDSISGGFTTLIGFATPAVADLAGGDGNAATSAAAGTLVTGTDQKSGTDIGLVFEATRVGGPTSPPDFTNSVGKVHVNNWVEVHKIDILQFHTGGGTPCSPLSTSAGIEFTADHELMAAWAIGLTTAAVPPPLPGGPVFASGEGTRGAVPAAAPAQPPVPVAPPPPWRWADTLVYDISAWPTCSYTASLNTRPALTTGLADRDVATTSVTFCIGGRRAAPTN